MCVCACVDPSLSLLSSPCLAQSAVCCSRPALSASEPAGSWRESPWRVSEPRGSECACARVPNWKTTIKKHTHSRFRQTLKQPGRVIGTILQPLTAATEPNLCGCVFLFLLLLWWWQHCCCSARTALILEWIHWLEQDCALAPLCIHRLS